MKWIESCLIVKLPSWTSSPAVRSPKTWENFHSNASDGLAGAPISSSPPFISSPELRKSTQKINNDNTPIIHFQTIFEMMYWTLSLKRHTTKTKAKYKWNEFGYNLITPTKLIYNNTHDKVKQRFNNDNNILTPWFKMKTGHWMRGRCISEEDRGGMSGGSPINILSITLVIENYSLSL